MNTASKTTKRASLDEFIQDELQTRTKTRKAHEALMRKEAKKANSMCNAPRTQRLKKK